MENQKIRVERVILLGSTDVLDKRVHFGPENSMYTASLADAVDTAVDRIRETDPDFQVLRWVAFEDRYLGDQIQDCVLLGDNLTPNV